jgi:hypothetical protein
LEISFNSDNLSSSVIITQSGLLTFKKYTLF